MFVMNRRADKARLFQSNGTTLIDAGHTWTSHAPTTYGRCPNGAAAFTVDPPTGGNTAVDGRKNQAFAHDIASTEAAATTRLANR